MYSGSCYGIFIDMHRVNEEGNRVCAGWDRVGTGYALVDMENTQVDNEEICF